MTSGNTEMAYNRIIERREKLTQKASETSPIFTQTNVPVDQKALSLFQDELSTRSLAVIRRFGKYCDWDLNAVYIPRNTNSDQQIFVAFASVLTYSKFIGDTLRTSIGLAGNVHRLGALESTPTIISLDTGTNLEEHFKKKRH